jgi:hypothetical protein
LAEYFRKFVNYFVILNRPLTDLLKKHALFVWTPTHEHAFQAQALKQALASASVLALPNFSKQFCIQRDACATGIAELILQGNHPIACLSKTLGPRN